MPPFGPRTFRFRQNTWNVFQRHVIRLLCCQYTIPHFLIDWCIQSTRVYVLADLMSCFHGRVYACLWPGSRRLYTGTVPQMHTRVDSPTSLNKNTWNANVACIVFCKLSLWSYVEVIGVSTSIHHILSWLARIVILTASPPCSCTRELLCPIRRFRD